MGDLDLYQRNDALPHSYTLKRDEPVKTAEGREVRRLEGSVTHVEVSRMGV